MNGVDVPNYEDETLNRKCKTLLDQYQSQYDEYNQQIKKYYQDLKLWQEQLDDDLQIESDLEQQELNFKNSQYIEWDSKIYSCLNNKSNKSCTNLSTGEHEKCKCQQLYGGRGHLHAPCDPQGSFMSQLLTKQMCEEKGYLSNKGIEHKTCKKHLELNLPEYKCDCPAFVEKPKVRMETPPKQPLLILPTITCGPCRTEFENLTCDFSHENISKVEKCINKLAVTAAVAANTVETVETAPIQVKNISPRVAGAGTSIDGSTKNIKDNGNKISGKVFTVSNVSTNSHESSDSRDSDDDTHNDKPSKGKFNGQGFAFLIILITILLTTLAAYLIYCIFRNIPDNPVCAKITKLERLGVQTL